MNSQPQANQGNGTVYDGNTGFSFDLYSLGLPSHGNITHLTKSKTSLKHQDTFCSNGVELQVTSYDLS